MNTYLTENDEILNLDRVCFFKIIKSFFKPNVWEVRSYFSEEDFLNIVSFSSEEAAKDWIKHFLIEFLQ